MYLDEAAVKKTIAAVFLKEFAPAKLEDISVTLEHDHDGDEILRVRIVFDSINGRLDPLKRKGLVRHLRAPLAEIDEHRFPVVSVRTKEEQQGEAA